MLRCGKIRLLLRCTPNRSFPRMSTRLTSRRERANAIRALSMDAVQKANSGHPGAPMGMADIAEVLWNDYLSHNPQNPQWVNRDRFVLSNGHGSMLIYSLLHLRSEERRVGKECEACWPLYRIN